MAGLQAIPLELGGDCEAAVSLWEQGEEVRGGIRYNAALFDAETIAGVAAHYQLLLRNAVANPDQGILWLSVLPEAERQRILHEWNCTEADYPRQACIHQLIENQVERTPDRVAAVFEAERLTYAELNARANRLAHYLQGLGVGPDTRVGVSLERSLEMLVAVLGVLKAGGAYVPLDPSYPEDRLAYMVEDSRMPVLISEARLAERLSVRPPSVVCLDSDREEIAKQSAGNLPNASATSENLAYVLYTSGSTGRPKGVQIPHRAVVNFLCTMARQPGLTAEDTLVAVTTLSFDISGLELYLPLVTGARVVLASSEVASDGTRLAELMGGSGVTVMQATPATWRLLIEAGWPGDRRLKILCGGEALSRPLADELLERCGELWNMYGPTETTIWSTVWKVEPGEGPILIGHPIGNTQAYILDANLQPVPASVAGELYVGGEGLARGYLNRPELTAQAFIPDPFRDTPGARLYRTGDLVRYRRNGEIEYLGRIDHQVKIRGFRIELGEVETVLASHPEIKETVVMAREDTPDAKRLVAYFTPSPGHAPTTPELRRFLKEKLPDYMLPSAFVRLNALPRTPNGKIDRRALPPPDQERPELDKAYVAPRNAAERKLAAIWEDILGSGRSASRTTTSTWERNRW
jgi:amino acid adenylation domain-containing protein